MVKYVFVVKDIIHLIVERSSIISDDILETISTSIGHMIAVKDIRPLLLSANLKIKSEFSDYNQLIKCVLLVDNNK